MPTHVKAELENKMPNTALSIPTVEEPAPKAVLMETDSAPLTTHPAPGAAEPEGAHTAAQLEEGREGAAAAEVEAEAPAPRALADTNGLDPVTQELMEAFAGYEARKEEWRHYRGYLLANVEPEFLIGRNVRVFWPDDALWYSGAVTAYNPYTLQHTVRG